MSSEPPSKRLPFEPRQKKKKTAKKTAKTPQKPASTPVTKADSQSPSLRAIPDGVSKRMIRRMALFSGIPSALGMSSFFIAYWIVSYDWFKLPPYVVLAVSLGLFGLGVLGLSYGIFSTSWDEDRLGSWWGWQEFKLNFGRTIDAWRTAKK